MAAKHDSFLVDAIKPPSRDRTQRVSYLDGFRFGFGFFISGLLISIVLGAIAWGLVAALHLH
jgi:hypothetical protein